MNIYIIFLLLTVFILTACTAGEQPEFQYDDEDFVFEDEHETPSQPEPSKEEPIPSKGKLIFTAKTQQTLPVIDTTVDVDMKIKGELEYTIAENGDITGSGTGETDATLKSSIGIADCEGTTHLDTEFTVTGFYVKESNLMIFKSHEIKPPAETMVLKCPYLGEDLTYELALPILFFVGGIEEGSGTFALKEGDVKRRITHPVEGWETNLPADWHFNIVFSDEFDFDVDVDPPITTIEQGSKATPSVTVKLVKGTAKNIKLTVTEWPTIKSFITNTAVTPTETTTLNVETTCDTKPDTYLFTVRGETKGTFKTSVDSASIVVTKNPRCP